MPQFLSNKCSAVKKFLLTKTAPDFGIDKARFQA